MIGDVHREYGFPRAANREETLVLGFDTKVPDFTGAACLTEMRLYYQVEAKRFLDILQRYAPGGFVDAVFGELAQRKATIYRVTA